MAYKWNAQKGVLEEIKPAEPENREIQPTEETESKSEEKAKRGRPRKE